MAGTELPVQQARCELCARRQAHITKGIDRDSAKAPGRKEFWYQREAGGCAGSDGEFWRTQRQAAAAGKVKPLERRIGNLQGGAERIRPTCGKGDRTSLASGNAAARQQACAGRDVDFCARRQQQ